MTMELVFNNQTGIDNTRYKEINEIKEEDKVSVIKHCSICKFGIFDYDYIEKDEHLYHKSCFHFAYCRTCYSKDDLQQSPLEGRIYCRECFEEVQKNRNYQRRLFKQNSRKNKEIKRRNCWN